MNELRNSLQTIFTSKRRDVWPVSLSSIFTDAPCLSNKSTISRYPLIYKHREAQLIPSCSKDNIFLNSQAFLKRRSNDDNLNIDVTSTVDQQKLKTFNVPPNGSQKAKQIWYYCIAWENTRKLDLVIFLLFGKQKLPELLHYRKRRTGTRLVHEEIPQLHLGNGGDGRYISPFFMLAHHEKIPFGETRSMGTNGSGLRSDN